MTIWPPNPEDLHRPAYRSLAETILRAIEAGELRPGDRLPTQRQLAYELGLSVQTVSRAYDGLIRRGAIAGEVGRGTFVCAREEAAPTPYLPDRQYGAIIDLSILKPVYDTIHDEAMRQALGDLSRDVPATVTSSFRPAVATRKYLSGARDWLKTCGIAVEGQGVLLTNGNTSAMTIALMTAASPGALMVADEISHHTLKPLADYLGLQVRGLSMDEQGTLPAAFEEACNQAIVSILHLMPTGLNPMARVMSLQRRRDLVEIARRHNVLIVENDAWGPMLADRPPPVAALAPERTFYFTSLTKCIMPGLRTGYLVVPETYESAAANRHLVTNWMATPLLAEIADRWIADGTAIRLLEWQRSALADRNARAAEILGTLPFHASPSGMHVWLPMPEAWQEADFVAHARLHGVAVAPGASFAINREAAHAGVRICLGSATMDEFDHGMRILARLARSQPEPALLAI